MDGQRFDAVARSLATRQTRRGTMRRLAAATGALIAAGILGVGHDRRCVSLRLPHGVDAWGVLWHAVVGAGLVAASAGAFNQLLERTSYGAMRRTADRPLPAGRLDVRQVFAFGAVTVALGLAQLAFGVGWLTPPPLRSRRG